MQKHVIKALQLWEVFTGVHFNVDNFNNMAEIVIGDSFNSRLREAIEVDPSGLTTALMLRYYVESVIDGNFFSARTLMNPEFQAKYHAIQEALNHPEIMSAIEQYEGKIASALRNYGLDRPDVLAIVRDPEHMGFILRDAYRAADRLTAHQFTQGKAVDAVPHYFSNIYAFADASAFVNALKGSTVDGVSLCLILDGDIIDTYFAFGVKRGNTITMLTDKPEWAHPRQKYMISAKSRTSRFVDRVERARFPYDLIDFQVEGKHVHFNTTEHALTISEPFFKLKPLADMNPDEIVWTVVLFGLIVERHFKQHLLLPDISYTGTMLRLQTPELQAPASTSLAVDQPHTVSVAPLTHQDINSEALQDLWAIKPKGINEWLVERYGHHVPEAVFNLLPGGNEDVTYYLPKPAQDHGLIDAELAAGLGIGKQSLIRGTSGTGLVVAESLTPTTLVPDVHKEVFFDRDKQHIRDFYKLDVLDPHSMGTLEKLERDRKWYARNNQTTVIRLMATREFVKRRKEIETEFESRVRGNLENLLNYAAQMRLETDVIEYMEGFARRIAPGNILSLADMTAERVKGYSYEWSGLMHNGGVNIYGEQKNDVLYCPINGTVATLTARFRPETADSLAKLCGCAVTELPDVLQHWTAEEPAYIGNPNLQNLDPMDWEVQNPWSKLRFVVTVKLSRSGFNQRRKSLGLPPNKWWMKDGIYIAK